MSTDWVQVVISLAYGSGVGGAMFVSATAIADGQRRVGRAMRFSSRVTHKFTPGLVRAGGMAFMVFGLLGAVLGLFFADKM